MDEPIMGQIQLFPFQYPPLGWFFCEGQILQISQHSTLFSLLWNRYGGDGKTTFALPDLRGKEPDPNLHYCIAWNGIYPPRD